MRCRRQGRVPRTSRMNCRALHPAVENDLLWLAAALRMATASVKFSSSLHPEPVALPLRMPIEQVIRAALRVRHIGLNSITVWVLR